jgi:hypothetical protein
VVWRNELSFRQQQLSELYGPIYGYLTSQRHVYDLWVEGKMNEKNVEVKHLFREQNQAIRNLIINKTHLIEGRIMPDSFVRFCSSTLIFDFYAAVAAEGDVPEHLKADARSAFPYDFYEHITTVTESLKARIEDLHASYAPPLRGTETSGGEQT